MSHEGASARTTGDDVADIGANRADAGGDLQQIQNLLFGAQAREFEEQLQRLERLVEERLGQLSTRVEEQLQRLEKSLSERLESSLAEESTQRTGENEALQAKLTELAAELEHSGAALGAQQREAAENVRDALQQLQASQEALVQQRTDHLESELQQSRRQLNDDKLSKQALSKLLEELAQKL